MSNNEDIVYIAKKFVDLERKHNSLARTRQLPNSTLGLPDGTHVGLNDSITWSKENGLDVKKQAKTINNVSDNTANNAVNNSDLVSNLVPLDEYGNLLWDSNQFVYDLSKELETTLGEVESDLELIEVDVEHVKETSEAMQLELDQAKTDILLAQSTADGKNKVVRSNAVANNANQYQVGDQWWQYGSPANQVIALWIHDGTVWASQELNNQVIANLDAGKITTGLLAADRIAANSIGATKLAAGAVTADKVAAGAITAGKIAVGGVNPDNLQDGTIGAVKLIANTITSREIKANSITGDKVAATTVNALTVNGGAIIGGFVGADEVKVSGTGGSTLTFFRDGKTQSGLWTGTQTPYLSISPNAFRIPHENKSAVSFKYLPSSENGNNNVATFNASNITSLRNVTNISMWVRNIPNAIKSDYPLIVSTIQNNTLIHLLSIPFNTTDGEYYFYSVNTTNISLEGGLKFSIDNTTEQGGEFVIIDITITYRSGGDSSVRIYKDGTTARLSSYGGIAGISQGIVHATKFANTNNGTHLSAPYAIQSGRLTMNAAVPPGGNLQQNITFASGRFAYPPQVFLSTDSGRVNLYVSSTTTTGFVLGANNWSPAAGSPPNVHWVAMQMLNTNNIG